MIYNYGIISVESKWYKKKVFIITTIIVIICLVIGGFIFAGIKLSQYNKQKEFDEIERLEQIKISNITQEKEQIKNEKERIRKEEERIKKEEEERIRKEQEESERKKRLEFFSEEQLSAIENIYDDTNEKRVFLTFDDGPTQSVTPYILDLLKQENIKATFFVLGERAEVNPELIQREYQEGHYIGNHSYSHVYRNIYSDVDSVFDEYNTTEQIIQDALGNSNFHSKLFRFPGGSTGGYYASIKDEAKEALRENGIASLDWNALSKDAEGAKTVEELVDNVIETVGDKQSVVILMHDAADKELTYEALPEIINFLRKNGYSFKNIYDIL